MRRSALLPLALAGLLAAPAAPVLGASFDCTKARSKLNRMICADAELSALDAQVWDFYGERIRTLSPGQHAHVRERHLAWRRQRGWFDNTVAEIKADYRRHFAWLSHALLPIEGRYESKDGHAIQVELDLAAQDRLSVLGEIRARTAYSWAVPETDEMENRVVRDADVAGARPSLVFADGVLRLRPVFLGRPPGPVLGCRFELRFADDALTLAPSGQCGGMDASTGGGLYRRPLRMPTRD